jgi:hypothetical protein
VLGALAYPASIFIFIIGASQDPKKVGYSFLNNLKRFGFQGLSPAARELISIPYRDRKGDMCP